MCDQLAKGSLASCFVLMYYWTDYSNKSHRIEYFGRAHMMPRERILGLPVCLL